MCLFHKGRETSRHVNALELIEKNNLSNLRKRIKILLIDDESDDIYKMIEKVKKCLKEHSDEKNIKMVMTAKT